MKITTALLPISAVALVLACAGDMTAKDPARNTAKAKKSQAQNKTTDKEWKRETEGHRPQDLNGDGVISRHEWPGNDASFREMDRDGDGVITNKDRGLGAQGGDTRMYDRPVNDYKTRARKK